MPLEKLKTLRKFSKFAKNEVKAVKIAVSTAMRDVLAAPRGVSADQKSTRCDKHPWNALCKLTHLLSYPDSKDAIAYIKLII